MNPYAYRFDIQDTGSGRYVVQFPDLPGFAVVGADVAEVVEHAHDLARVWLLRYGRVPLPSKRDR